MFISEAVSSGYFIRTIAKTTECTALCPAGVTNTARIQENIKAAIGGKFPLYCLGFGFDVNFDFLEKMALENDGVARRIYEDSDADLQLQVRYSALVVFGYIQLHSGCLATIRLCFISLGFL